MIGGDPFTSPSVTLATSDAAKGCATVSPPPPLPPAPLAPRAPTRPASCAFCTPSLGGASDVLASCELARDGECRLPMRIADRICAGRLELAACTNL